MNGNPKRYDAAERGSQHRQLPIPTARYDYTIDAVRASPHPTRAEFRLDTDRVRISRNDQGDLVIHPLRAERGAALLQALQALGEIDDDFIAALDSEQTAALPVQEREAL